MVSQHVLEKIYLSEMEKDVEKYSDVLAETIKERDIENLPEPVQKYFRNGGYIGRIKMFNAKIILENTFFRRAPNNRWMKLNVYQYNSVIEPVRIVYLQKNILGIFPFEARDKYQDGKGNMLIRLLKLVTVADAKGREMDQSGLVTILSETFIVPNYALQDYIKWETINKNEVKAILTFKGLKVEGIFSFNNEGEMVRFYTEDRYFVNKDGTFKKNPWSIYVEAYKVMNGVKVPSYIRVVWHLEEGDFEYFKGNISNIDYNIEYKLGVV